jgi:hypothetical protein
MQCAYCGSSALHCSLLMVLSMHDTQMVSPPDATRVYSATGCVVLFMIIAWFICVLLCGVCSVRAQISLRKRGRHLARLWKLCTGLHSVERSLYAQHTDCVATWCTTSALLAMYRVVLCCVLFCVNSTQRMAACLHCECVVNYAYSIVNVLHCYIFYGDFLHPGSLSHYQ